MDTMPTMTAAELDALVAARDALVAVMEREPRTDVGRAYHVLAKLVGYSADALAG